MANFFLYKTAGVFQRGDLYSSVWLGNILSFFLSLLLSLNHSSIICFKPFSWCILNKHRGSVRPCPSLVKAFTFSVATCLGTNQLTLEDEVHRAWRSKAGADSMETWLFPSLCFGNLCRAPSVTETKRNNIIESMHDLSYASPSVSSSLPMMRENRHQLLHFSRAEHTKGNIDENIGVRGKAENMCFPAHPKVSFVLKDKKKIKSQRNCSLKVTTRFTPQLQFSVRALLEITYPAPVLKMPPCLSTHNWWASQWRPEHGPPDSGALDSDIAPEQFWVPC